MGRHRLKESERRTYMRMLVYPETVEQLHDLAKWSKKTMIRFVAELVAQIHRRETRRQAKREPEKDE